MRPSRRSATRSCSSRVVHEAALARESWSGGRTDSPPHTGRSCTIHATPAPLSLDVTANVAARIGRVSPTPCRASSGTRFSSTRIPATSPGRSSSATNRRLCATTPGQRSRSSPESAARGSALLQGLVVCGVCGDRMTVRYHSRESQQVPVYVCQRERIEHAGRICQHIPGAAIDEAIGTLLLETVTPTALEVALAGARRSAQAHRGGRPSTSPARREGPTRSRARPPTLHAGRPGQPPGRRRPRGRLERQVACVQEGSGTIRQATRNGLVTRNSPTSNVRRSPH